MLKDWTNAQRQLSRNEERVKRLTDEWADKWGAAAAILQENRILALRRAGSGVMLECEHAHLLCLDGGVTLFRLEDGDNFVARVGKGILVDCTRANMPRVDCVVTCRRHDDVTLHVSEGVTCFVNNELVRSDKRLTPGEHNLHARLKYLLRQVILFSFLNSCRACVVR